MQKHFLFTLIILFSSEVLLAQTKVLDKKTKDPIAYATVSFGDGYGTFADEEGVFVFNKKLYPDVDSLYISALGFRELKLSAKKLSNTLYLEEDTEQLNEVLLSVKLDRKFKERTLKPHLDDDYYHCWLPTIESEIAVFFNDPSSKDEKLSKVHIPIALESKDWSKRNRSNADKKPFSTLFKVNFYDNDNGFPGKPLVNKSVTFRATEKNGDAFDLDVAHLGIMIPKNGLYISIQVMGYTDKFGKLLPNKKYKEITSRGRTVKIPTNFRPLLPFTDEMNGHNTYVKRVFISNNRWKQFRKGNVNSNLLKSGLNNYGMGISYKEYKDE